MTASAAVEDLTVYASPGIVAIKPLPAVLGARILPGGQTSTDKSSTHDHLAV